MTVANKKIVDTYSKLFEGLHPVAKLKLIERLSRSLKKETNINEKNFFKAFGSFPEDKDAEEIINEIRDSRKLREKEFLL